MHIKQIFALCLAALMLSAPVAGLATATRIDAVAVAPMVREVQTEIGSNVVRYPQLEGMADEQVQQRINDAIVEKAKIAQRMVTLTTLSATGAALSVTDTTFLGSGVFSTVIDAVGTMENGRSGQEYTAMTFDLSTGEPVGLESLFGNPDKAVAFLEQILQGTYADELSSYLIHSDLAPLPRESFSLDANGITFYYPADQLSLLSGYSGAAQFDAFELTDWLLEGADALPAKLGWLPETLSDPEIRTLIMKAVQAGSLPHTPVTVGESLQSLIDRFRLLRDPDQYPGGRYFQMEAPAFRQTLVLSDALTSDWSASAVTGVLSFRENLFGVAVGETSQTRWREILGQPDSSVAFDEDMAFDYGLPVGTADYYTIGNRQLLLYAGEDNLLWAVRLT